ncbi:MAG: hypothetical protein HY070_11370, partial [Chloroflexi bacterium]|nr:hypothetical protein [Chloroflexota bacterium]
MNKKNFALIGIISVVGIFASGCGTATPTRAPVPLATQAPLVITVVVTTTPLPVTATPESALGTATVATTQAAITPTRLAALPTSTTARVATATRRPATLTTASASPSPTATVFIAKYSAPKLIGPNFVADQGGRKDIRHFPG